MSWYKPLADFKGEAMRYMVIILLFVISTVLVMAQEQEKPAESSIANPGWLFDEEIDPLTDQVVSTAILVYVAGTSKRAAIVRCREVEFDVYFDFGEFLDTEKIPVRYRVDKAPLVEEEWLPAGRTGVFADDKIGLARQLMNGATFIIEVTDYRGQPHRASFDLTGANDALKPVLQQCGISEVGLEQQVDELRRDIAFELEQWGPKQTLVYKKILMARNGYEGPEDTTIEPSFALAVQHFYDDYFIKCKDRKVRGTFCDILHSLETSHNWNELQNWHLKPRISSVLYEQAPYSLKKEAGKLKMGD